MILSAQTIRTFCVVHDLMVPFSERTHFMGASYGLSPAGYDLRLVLRDDAEKHVLSPGKFLLAATEERFHMPNHLLGIVHDKSTWARKGLSVFNTVIEPGWNGWLTLELINHGPAPIVLHRGVGIAQVVFHVLDHGTSEPYPDQGKYQNQEYGPVGPRS